MVFFEVAEYEKDSIKKAFPKALLIADKLDADNATEFSGVEIVSTFIYSKLNPKILTQLKNLRFIATRSTGFNHIDLDYCRKHNIAVSNVPEYGSNTVAEHTFGLIITLTRKLYQSINQAKNLNFNHLSLIGTDLYGKTIGIVGLGKIGKNVLRIAKGFGMKVLVYTHSHDEELSKQLVFKYVDLKTLLRNSDIITLHLPLTQNTKHIINMRNIQFVKKGSYLINTARGGLVETESLLYALNKNILSGIGIDVLEEEESLSEEVDILTPAFQKRVNLQKLLYNHVLLNHPKVIFTPHNAFNSKEALHRIINTTVLNIKSFIQEEPVNIVSITK